MFKNNWANPRTLLAQQQPQGTTATLIRNPGSRIGSCQIYDHSSLSPPSSTQLPNCRIFNQNCIVPHRGHCSCHLSCHPLPHADQCIFNTLECSSYSSKDSHILRAIECTIMFDISASVKTVTRHYKEGNLNWPMIIYITLAHIAGLIGLFTIGQCHKYTLLWAFILWPIRSVVTVISCVNILKTICELYLKWDFIIICSSAPRSSIVHHHSFINI